jgi:hypothetical protein
MRKDRSGDRVGLTRIKPCCEDMRRQLTSLVVYSEKSGQFGIRVHDGGSSWIAIRHRPWCGARLVSE